MLFVLSIFLVQTGDMNAIGEDGAADLPLQSRQFIVFFDIQFGPHRQINSLSTEGLRAWTDYLLLTVNSSYFCRYIFRNNFFIYLQQMIESLKVLRNGFTTHASQSGVLSI